MCGRARCTLPPSRVAERFKATSESIEDEDVTCMCMRDELFVVGTGAARAGMWADLWART